MDTDSKQPQTTPISHQRVLSTLTAVCTQESVIHEVIPRLVEHVQHLCDGKGSTVINSSRLLIFILIYKNRLRTNHDQHTICMSIASNLGWSGC